MAEQEKGWLSVKEAAERLGRSEDSVRRMIRAYKLPASRSSHGSRSAWLVSARGLERQLAADAERAAVRERLAGSGGGYGPEGRVAAVEAAAAYQGASLTDDDRDKVRADYRRDEAMDRLAAEMYTDPAVRQSLEQLDEEERIEHAARELARRVRREERIRERALEILDEEDE